MVGCKALDSEPTSLPNPLHFFIKEMYDKIKENIYIYMCHALYNFKTDRIRLIKLILNTSFNSTNENLVQVIQHTAEKHNFSIAKHG